MAAVIDQRTLLYKMFIKPGFHLQKTPRPRHKKQNHYMVEQSSFALIALFGLKIGRCRGRNWLYSLVSITRKMPRPRDKNKAIIRLSSHPSRYSLCFDSKMVVVVVVIGLMETRLMEPRPYI